MAGNLFEFSFPRAVDTNGTPISGAKLYAYATTSSTPKNTYSESTLSTANANPVVADSAGQFGPMYMLTDGAYKLVLKDASDNTIWTRDPVDFRVSTTAASQLAGTGLTASAGVLSLDVNGLTETTVVDPAADYVPVYDASVAAMRKAKPQNLVALPPNHLSGLWLSNNSTDSSHDIDFTAGRCRDATNTANIVLGALIKQLDATFAEGTNQGAMVSGESLPAAGTVHLWAIVKADGTADICANNHASSGLSPTLPTGYSYKRRLGSVLTSSGSVVAFIQNGDHFELVTPVLSIDVDPDTSGTSRALTVPLGLKLLAHFNMLVSGAGSTGVYISNPAQTDSTPSSTAAPLHVGNVGLPSGAATLVSHDHWTRTDTSGQVRTRNLADETILRIATLGWIDTRGRDA